MWIKTSSVYDNARTSLDMEKTLNFDCYSLEYQQNNLSLQFCPAYNLPIWLQCFQYNFSLLSADVSWCNTHGDKLEDCKQDTNAD